MKTIRLAYAPLKNAGDVFNVGLIEKLSGKCVEQSKVYNADMMAIGGALFGTQYSDDSKRKLMQKVASFFFGNKPLYVWGSGFWIDDNKNSLYRKNLKVCALRGEKTRQKLSALTGEIYDVPLADAGLLIDLFLKERLAPKYKMGVIPHMSQMYDPLYKKLSEQDGGHMIDITQSPEAVIEEIALCETIASSSLHGLIFADSLHIPSLHLIGENIILGGLFKFQDYYSCYQLDNQPWDISKSLPTAEDIINNYKVDSDLVELKKQQLIESFPKF